MGVTYTKGTVSTSTGEHLQCSPCPQNHHSQPNGADQAGNVENFRQTTLRLGLFSRTVGVGRSISVQPFEILLFIHTYLRAFKEFSGSLTNFFALHLIGMADSFFIFSIRCWMDLVECCIEAEPSARMTNTAPKTIQAFLASIP